MKMNRFNRSRNLYVLVILLVSFIPVYPQQSYRAGSVEDPSVQLDVDVLLDSNDPAYQSCTALPNDCSLRGAISKANEDPGQTYLISLPAGIYELSIPGVEEEANATGDLDLRSNIQLIGADATVSVIDAMGIDRVLQIHIGVTATIQDVTLTGGWTADGVAGIGNGNGGDSENGGGIYNAGTLILLDSDVYANHTGSGGEGGWGDPAGNGGKSGNGGGIYNTGWLTIENTDVINNSTGMGGTGGSISPPPSWNCGVGGNSGNGGGIYNTGSLGLNNSRLSANKTSSGGEGGWYEYIYYIGYCVGGQGGSGGGIYNIGSMQIDASEINLNVAGNGAIDGGSGGEGGGIYNSSSLTINNSQVYGNATGDGAIGYDHEGGWGGSGGGIYNHRGQLFITDSLVEGNQTGSGGRGGSRKYDGPLPGGNGGRGGGIFNLSGEGIFNLGASELYIYNTPIRDNTTGSGGPSLGTWMSDPYGNATGEGGTGGGLYNDGDANILFSQVTGNVTGNGGDENCLTADGMGGSGGGIYNSGNLSLSYSPVLSNTAGKGGDTSDNCSGRSGGSGGGIYNTGTLVTDFCPVRENTAGQGGDSLSIIGDNGGDGGDGGGFYNSGDLDITNSMIYENNAGSGGLGSGGYPDGSGGYGGGLYTYSGQITLVNAIIAENTIQPGSSGSGMYLRSSAELFHLTLARNTGGDGDGISVISSTVYLTNTIMVSHTIGISVNVNSWVSLADTLWGSEDWANGVDWSGNGTIITGTHNIWADPLFVNPDWMDYHLSASSPAIDQGIPTMINRDIDNEPRPNPDTNLPDLGADETWYFDWKQFLPVLYTSSD